MIYDDRLLMFFFHISSTEKSSNVDVELFRLFLLGVHNGSSGDGGERV